MRFVLSSKLNVGDIVAMPIFDNKYILLLNKGMAVTAQNIQQLEALGIAGVYIDDEISKDIEINPMIPMELRNEIMTSLKYFDLDRTIENAKTLVETLADTQFTDSEFINLKTLDDYTYEHSLSVAVYSVLIAIASKQFNEESLLDLAIAALLHDIGKLNMDSSILNKPGKLTAEEYKLVQSHAEKGYDMVRNSITIKSTIKMGIYEHHENEDGTGYPRGVMSDEIYLFAKIIHIADVYDAQISQRPYRDSLSCLEAMSFIIAHAGTMFAKEYVDIFASITPVYPKGTIVMLSNGEKAIVQENHVGYMIQPTVRTFSGRVLPLREKQYHDICIIDF